jgi:hypothetical protein
VRVVETMIGSREFAKRLEALCLSGAGPQLPRKRRDKHILLKSIALTLRQGHVYTEAVINKALKVWLFLVGHSISMDHVSLRRHLVDEGYLVRDAAGSRYEVAKLSSHQVQFEPSVDKVDPVGLVRAARIARAEKRAKHQ